MFKGDMNLANPAIMAILSNGFNGFTLNPDMTFYTDWFRFRDPEIMANITTSWGKFPCHSPALVYQSVPIGMIIEGCTKQSLPYNLGKLLGCPAGSDRNDC